MLDTRDTPLLKWKVLKQTCAPIELAGPSRLIKMAGQVHKECTIQIPIKNLSSTVACVNAVIDGLNAESMTLTPETATVPGKGSIIFLKFQHSCKYKYILTVL